MAIERDKLESLLIDYIEDRLTTDDRLRVEEELSASAAALKMYQELVEVMAVIDQVPQLEPDARSRDRFSAMLSGETRRSEASRIVLFNPAFYRAAAAIALMVISGGIGYWISRQEAQQDRLTAVEQEVTKTKGALAETRRVMLAMLDNPQSASQRLKGVNVAREMTDADSEIVNALFHAMLSDPNTNVRLAALEALSRFREDPLVRKGLIAALSKQNDPVIQIHLIQLMVVMKEKGVVDELQRIVEDEGMLKAVKDEAYTGILKLS